MGNSSMNTRLDSMDKRIEELENQCHIKDVEIAKQNETIVSNEEQIKTLESEMSTVKKVILNQQIFAEQIQHLCEVLAAGEASAVADFMASETQRKFQDVLALRV